MSAETASKVFTVEITRIDEYEVSVDESVWTPDAIEDWANSFYPAETSEDIAKHLAESIMRNGSGHGFFEGFGYVKMFYPDGSIINQFKEGFQLVADEEYSAGISVTIIYEDEDYDINSNEKSKQ